MDQVKQPKTPVKAKSTIGTTQELCFIVSAQKPKGLDFVQEIFQDTSDPNILFFSSNKEQISQQQFISRSEDESMSFEESSSQEPIDQEKFQTVKKMQHENLIANQGKHLTTARTNTKGCNCDKSKCSKNYCACYKMGNTCSSDCQCVDCQNVKITSEHLKNQKVALQLLSNSKQKGCNCKNSNCLKNYCICHQYGRKCSQICKCQNCHNTNEKSTTDRDQHNDEAMRLNFSSRKRIKINEFEINQNFMVDEGNKQNYDFNSQNMMGYYN